MTIVSYFQSFHTPPTGAEATSQVGASPGASAPPARPQNEQAPLVAQSFEGSINRTLLVTAPPYNAKCYGVTDDQAAIQAAFNTAGSTKSVQFPAGICLTSTIVWKGQSFFGAGRNLTYIKGKPGQDVFQTPDNIMNVLFSSTTVHDLNIQVDVSVNAAATAGGGNNTFPNRVAGTIQRAAFTIPIAPRAPVFGYGMCSGKGVNATASSTSVTFTCTQFPISYAIGALDPALVIGAPITINGAGATGGTYT
jgi:hypothetical protein